MKKSALLGLVGAAIAAIGTFLPFISFMGMGISLFGATSGRAIMVIALAGAAGVFAFLGKEKGNSFPIISVAAGVIGSAITLFWMTQAMQMSAGMGAYLMPVGCVLATIGGVLAMKGN